jgi:DNA-binding MarR family transcriptional regulator
LIEKRRSKIDQRKYDVKLTVAGRRHLEEAAALSQASVEQLLDAYTEQERESLMMLLRKGVRHFSRML